MENKIVHIDIKWDSEENVTNHVYDIFIKNQEEAINLISNNPVLLEKARKQFLSYLAHINNLQARAFYPEAMRLEKAA